MWSQFTNVTDRQTDDMRTQYRALHWSASRGNYLCWASLLLRVFVVIVFSYSWLRKTDKKLTKISIYLAMSDSQKRICYLYDPDVGNFHFGMVIFIVNRRRHRCASLLRRNGDMPKRRQPYSAVGHCSDVSKNRFDLSQSDKHSDTPVTLIEEWRLTLLFLLWLRVV